MPRNSWVKLQGQSQQLTQHKGTAGGPQHPPSPLCQQLGHSPAVREEIPRLSSSTPPLAPLLSCHWPQCLRGRAQLWSLGPDTALKLPAPHTRGWSASMNPAGSCTWRAAPKHRELEQPFCRPHRCWARSCCNVACTTSLCGMRWRMFLRKLEVLLCSTGAEAGCGKGWWASQRTPLLSPSPLCTPAVYPSQYNEQLSLPSWKGNGKISMP